MSNAKSETQEHGVYYVGELRKFRSWESKGYHNGQITLEQNDFDVQVDYSPLDKDGNVSSVAAQLADISKGTDVVVKVIPGQMRKLKSGNGEYFKRAYALSVEVLNTDGE